MTNGNTHESRTDRGMAGPTSFGLAFMFIALTVGLRYYDVFVDAVVSLFA